MFGSEILDIAIGLILVYLLLSLICTVIREGLEAWTKTRAVHLERGIRALLHDPKGEDLAKDLYDHPLVSGLYRGSYEPSKIKKNGQMPVHQDLPTYIPAGNFARALLDIVAHRSNPREETDDDSSNAPISLEGIRASAKKISNESVRRALLFAIDTADGDFAGAQANLEAWYNSAMDRVAGWYRRRTQYILLAVGLIVTVILNANTFMIANALSQDDALRQALVLEAGLIAHDTSREAALRQADLRERYAELDRLGLPIGWADGWPGPEREEGQALWSYVGENPWDGAVAPIVGWLITVLAISLGAPFWFDVLNKFMVIRSTVKPHEKSPEEASEDRQRSRLLLQESIRRRGLAAGADGRDGPAA